MPNLEGHCLCKGVAFQADGDVTRVTACHCAMCRRQNGGGAFHTLVLEGDVTFSSQSTLKWFETSDWAKRGFCENCGSTLFWQLKDSDHYDISLGAITNLPDLELNAHIFVDQAGSYETIAENVPHMTEAEVFAQHNGASS